MTNRELVIDNSPCVELKELKEVREVKAVCFMAKNKKISQFLRYFKILFIPLHSLLRLWRNW